MFGKINWLLSSSFILISFVLIFFTIKSLKKNDKEKKKSKFNFLETILIPFRLVHFLKVFENFELYFVLLVLLKIIIEMTSVEIRYSVEGLFKKLMQGEAQSGFRLLFIIAMIVGSVIVTSFICMLENEIIKKSTKSIKEYVASFVIGQPNIFFLNNERGFILDKLDDCHDKIREIINFSTELIDSSIKLFSIVPRFRTILSDCLFRTTSSVVLFFAFFFFTISLSLFFCLPKAQLMSIYSNANSRASSHTQQQLTDIINNVTHVKNTGTEYESMNFFNEFTRKEYEIYKCFSEQNTQLKLRINLFTESTFLSLIAWIFFAHSAQNPAGGTVIASVFEVRGISTTINDLMEHVTFNFETANKFYSALSLFTNGNIEEIFDSSCVDAFKKEEKKEKEQIKNVTININGVTVTDQKNRPILNNINLTIKPGDKIAIVGSSGSGKSTLLNVMIRNLEPDAGNVNIGNVNIEDYNEQIFFNTISFIPQDNNLFNRTVLDNITLGRKTSEEEIKKACKMAECWDLINSLPKKFNFVVGNNGERLSGGQKQRIVIARNLLNFSSKVLFLDEATSALDLKTEKDVLDNILTVHSDKGSDDDVSILTEKTVVLVSHRLDFLQKYNNFTILVMKKGCIIQSGTLAELLKDTEGEFSSLWLSNREE